MNFFKKTLLMILGLLSLSVGLIAIGLERQADWAENEVRSWSKHECLLEDVEYGDESFRSKCSYTRNGHHFYVKNQTPVWNQYFDMVSKRPGGVEVFFISGQNKKYRFQFRKGQVVDFWYDPRNPENSVLMPAAGSLKALLYFGFGYYTLLFIALVAGWRKKLFASRSAAKGNTSESRTAITDEFQ